MKVIFAGTPAFAATALEALLAAGFEVPLVLSQPDRPAGRGLKLQASSVKQAALSRNRSCLENPVQPVQQPIQLCQPRSLRLDGKYPDDAAAARQAIEGAQADVMVVAAYGLILPQWVLDTPRLGCLNIHASLLPRWRGAAPIHRAIEAGDTQSGVTIMQMDAGLDTGDMLATGAVSLLPGATLESVHDALAALGASLLIEVLHAAQRGALHPVKQPADGVTYAHKIDKSEAFIDWRHSAAAIERRIRAFNPLPGAASTLGAEVIKFRRAERPGLAAPAGAQPGQVLAASAGGVDIATGDGVLRVTTLQKAGGKPLAAADFLRGFDLAPGSVFASAPAPASASAPVLTEGV